jgi:hypothetical protein
MRAFLFIGVLAVFVAIMVPGCGPSVSKSALEAHIKDELQRTLGTDKNYSAFEMFVEEVGLNPTGPEGGVKRDGKKIFGFEGAATVIFDFSRYEVPLSAEAAADGWRAWSLKPDALGFLDGVIFIPMQFVGGDKFNMGCTSEQGSSCYNKEKPAHSVTVDGFLIGRHPVTQGQWNRVMAKNLSEFKGDDLPVDNVSWNDAQNFIKKLNSMSGKAYRLPTEAEWEYAARGGTKSRGRIYAGSDNVDDVAWHSMNSDDKTQPVGAKSPNELGIYDMSGNVWEWVNDWYGGYGGSPQANPAGPPSGSTRVNRGGAWEDDARLCRITSRGDNTPESRFNSLGFRLARNL